MSKKTVIKPSFKDYFGKYLVTAWIVTAVVCAVVLLILGYFYKNYCRQYAVNLVECYSQEVYENLLKQHPKEAPLEDHPSALYPNDIWFADERVLSEFSEVVSYRVTDYTMVLNIKNNPSFWVETLFHNLFPGKKDMSTLDTPEYAFRLIGYTGFDEYTILYGDLEQSEDIAQTFSERSAMKHAQKSIGGIIDDTQLRSKMRSVRGNGVISGSNIAISRPIHVENDRSRYNSYEAVFVVSGSFVRRYPVGTAVFVLLTFVLATVFAYRLARRAYLDRLEIYNYAAVTARLAGAGEKREGLISKTGSEKKEDQAREFDPEKAEEQKSEVEPMLASVVVTKEKISLEELCLEVLGKMSETLRSSGQESCFKVEMKPVITSNRQLLEKALTGILLYASEYSRAGETITVTLSRKELVVEKSLLRKEISVGTVGKSYGGTFRPEKDEHLLEAKLALDLAGLELASGAMDGRVKLKVLFETEEFLVR
ncbi:MAG: hypothetical protein J5825_08885 [Lachnospiraceae bacterium]|nr:hypothetical protein [Lachnospiraceae bacterium]